MLTKKKLYYIALIVGIGILIHSLTAIDLNNLEVSKLLSSGIWLLFIVVVLVSIRDIDKKDAEDDKNLD